MPPPCVPATELVFAGTRPLLQAGTFGRCPPQNFQVVSVNNAPTVVDLSWDPALDVDLRLDDLTMSQDGDVFAPIGPPPSHLIAHKRSVAGYILHRGTPGITPVGKAIGDGNVIADQVLLGPGATTFQDLTAPSGGTVAYLLSTIIDDSFAEPFLDSLEGYWKFNGNGDDASGQGRPLSFSGTTVFGSGLLGLAYALSGVAADTAFRGANDTVLDFAGGVNFTISLWVDFNALAGEQTLIEKFVGPGGPGWSVTKLVGNQFRFLTAGGTIDTASLAAADAAYHHVLIRRLGGDISIWYDGILRITSFGFPAITVTTNPLLIGERQGAQSFPVDGSLDEVAIWTRALSSGEIAQLFNSGAGRAL